MALKKKIESILVTDLNKKIFSHTFWILSGNIISKTLLLIATILMTKYMGKEEYGQFGIIKSTILMFAIFAGMEMGITATKYISQYHNIDNKKVEKIVGISNLFAIIVSILVLVFVFFFSKHIAEQINAPQLDKEIQMSSLVLFFSSLNGIQNGILAGLEKFKELSINTTISGIISSVGLIMAAKYFSLKVVVIAFGLNYILLFLFNFITLKRVFYSNFKINIFSKNNFEEASILWKFSLPAILAGLMVGPVTWLCNYFLVKQPNGYLEMADFDIANQWRNTILFIPAALSQIALPMLSSSFNNNDDYKKIFNKNLKINIYLGFTLVVLFCLFTPMIVSFYGHDYERATIPMIIMFITTGFITINNVIGQAIASQGKMWFGFFVNFIWACVLVISCYILVIRLQMGAVGICLSYLISYMIHTLLQFLFIKQKLNT